MSSVELVPGDRGLLALQVEANWPVDGYGRLTGPGAPRLVVAAAADGVVVAASAGVPDAVVVGARAAVVGVRPEPPPTRRAPRAAGATGEPGPSGAADGPASSPAVPTGVRRARELVEEATGPVTLSAGPCYLIPPEVRYAPTARVVTSDGGDPAALRAANPGNWGEGEWDDLLDGALGPWAMAVAAGRVIAICHTPCWSARAAEAGVWTRPGCRGRGHAATVTAAWARVMAAAGDGRRLFYSTTATNHASQRVTRRLGLRQLGWMWKLTA
ncbi:GNAT family N-acetyltransferase [Streptomyces youssoufiensis]